MALAKRVVAVLLALVIVGSSLVVVLATDAGATESGVFPDRTFVLTKGKGGVTSVTAGISPLTDCMWWVELASLGGSAVRVDVYELSSDSVELLSHSRVSEVGQASDHVRLSGGGSYSATFQYEGKPGISTLNERISTSPVGKHHKPILISSDAEFTEANGVTSGSGSSGDPYMILGWNIRATTASCIEIRDTTAYFEIKGVSLSAADYDFAGVALFNVSNGAVFDSTVTNCWYGIHVAQSSNIAVARCDLSGDVMELRVEYSSNVDIRDSSLVSDNEGLGMDWCNNIVISNCTVIAGYTVCWLSSCRQGLVQGNSMTLLDRRGIGLYLLESSYITVYSNELINTSIDIVDFGTGASMSLEIAANNTANGRPILQYKGQKDLALDSLDAGEVILVQCQNVTVSNMSFSDNFGCVIADWSSQIAVRDCTFTSSFVGVRVEYGNFVQICRNVMTEMTFNAIGVWDSMHVVIDGNSVSSLGVNSWGMMLMPIYRTPFLEIANNTLSDGYDGLLVFGLAYAKIAGNTFSRMAHEALRVWVSNSLTIVENVFVDNAIGLVVAESNLVLTYHNNFVGNTVQAQDIGNTASDWDAGYPVGGNYWSDYGGSDADADGIGDSPYYIAPSGAADRYPLMAPWAL